MSINYLLLRYEVKRFLTGLIYFDINSYALSVRKYGILPKFQLSTTPSAHNVEAGLHLPLLEESSDVSCDAVEKKPAVLTQSQVQKHHRNLPDPLAYFAHCEELHPWLRIHPITISYIIMILYIGLIASVIAITASSASS